MLVIDLQCDRVPGPLATKGQAPQLESLGHNRSSRGRHRVPLATEEQNNWTDTEHDGRQKKRQPISHVLLCVHHGYGSDKGADVDHEVEVEEDASDGLRGIDDDALTGLRNGLDEKLGLLVLFGNQGRDVGPVMVRLDSSMGSDNTYLNPPTPIPKITRPTAKQANAPFACTITGGIEEMMMIM